jgi:phosphohistidine swiveling domain-containing protein
VHDPEFELTREDFEKVEADLLATGYRFEMSAVVSLQEEPEKYKPVEGHAESGAHETDEEGRPIVGSGDNVFRAKADVSGTARFISKVETVMDMLTAGVPEDTIAIIDDSGGTLTAPVLGEFAGVVCMGGTIRSHLGILTREYGVPCLMAAQLDGLREGDKVTVEYSKAAADAYADADTAAAQRARIIKTS